MSMTAEHRTFIEAKDIVAIELRCACGGSVRYPLLKMQPDGFKANPHHRCPNCGQDLLTPAQDGPEGELYS